MLISQALGANKREQASRIAALSIVFNLILGILISALLAIFSRPILLSMGAQEKILDYGTEYLLIVGVFLFTQALLGTISVIIRNHGFTRVTMYVTVVMNIINTFLDIVFVLGLLGFPKLGIRGVAIATSFSRIVGVVVLLIILFKRIEKPKIFKLLRPFPGKDMLSLLKIGIPSAFESFNYNLSQLVVTAIVLNFLTQTELITKTYVSNIAMFFYIFTVSIGQGAQILVGHKVGARDFDSAYKQGMRAFSTAFIISMALSLLGILLRYQLMALFTKDTAVISAGAVLIILNIFVEAGRTSNIIIISSLRGAGDVIFPTGVAIFSMWILSTFCGYLLAVVLGMGLNGLWVAFAADECFRGVLMLWRWRTGKWRLKRIA